MSLVVAVIDTYMSACRRSAHWRAARYRQLGSALCYEGTNGRDDAIPMEVMLSAKMISEVVRRRKAVTIRARGNCL